MRKFFVTILLLSTFYACQKSEPFDSPDKNDFDRLYCNDPIAINYNFNFPGTVDNSTCIYPTDVFEGSFLLRDSIYNAEFALDTVNEITVSFVRLSQTELLLKGFCPSGDTLTLTADRYYRASVDSTLILPDSTFLDGQVFCRSLDTLSGFIKSITDSNRIQVNFTIVSDTGVNYHIGTGTKL